MTPGFLLFGFSPISPEWPHPSRLIHPLPCAPTHPSSTHTHTHSTSCRSMTVSCGFSGPAVTCVLLIYRHNSRQASPPFTPTPAQAPAPLSTGIQHSQGLSPCQYNQLYQQLSGSCIGSTVFSCASTYVVGNSFKSPPPFPQSTHTHTLCPLPFSHPQRCSCNGDNTRSETLWHHKKKENTFNRHLRFPQATISTFMAKRFLFLAPCQCHASVAMAHPRGYCSHLSLFLSFTRVGGAGLCRGRGWKSDKLILFTPKALLCPVKGQNILRGEGKRAAGHSP